MEKKGMKGRKRNHRKVKNKNNMKTVVQIKQINRRAS